ncbi:MAG TPA: hypothetical protein VJ625_07780 [Propionibacteriaceae bacterium]|nr:hypothetical protein [Propionibacteriaceae bacterium]
MTFHQLAAPALGGAFPGPRGGRSGDTAATPSAFAVILIVVAGEQQFAVHWRRDDDGWC